MNQTEGCSLCGEESDKYVNLDRFPFGSFPELRKICKRCHLYIKMFCFIGKCKSLDCYRNRMEIFELNPNVLKIADIILEKDCIWSHW